MRSVYSGPVFDVAIDQFGAIANHPGAIGVEKVRAARTTRGVFP